MSAGRPAASGPGWRGTWGRGRWGARALLSPLGPTVGEQSGLGVGRPFLSSLGPQSSFLPLCSEHQLSLQADCGTQISWTPLQE